MIWKVKGNNKEKKLEALVASDDDWRNAFSILNNRVNDLRSYEPVFTMVGGEHLHTLMNIMDDRSCIFISENYEHGGDCNDIRKDCIRSSV
jgi:hypothetical protein